MSLATLHTDAHRLLVAARAYPSRLAARAAIAIAVHVFRTEPALAHAMQSWRAAAKGEVSLPPPAFIESGRAPAFALIGVANRRPRLLIGAVAAFVALPVLILYKFF